MQAYYWLILFAILLGAEMITVGLTTIWFAGGSLVAFFAALAGMNVYMQITLWLIVSFVLLIFTRPFALRYLNREDRERTNVDSLIGQEAYVCETISNKDEKGKVKINGIEWTARGEGLSSMIEKDCLVRILRVEGVKVIVEKV